MIPVEEVRKADKSPAVIRAQSCAPEKIWYSGTVCHVVLGSVTCDFYPVKDCITPILIDGHRVLGVDFCEGKMLLTFDPFPGIPSLSIVENEVQIFPSVWDVEWVGKRLTFRDADREILFRIKFEPPHTLHIENAIVQYNGLLVMIDERGIYLPNVNVNVDGIFFQGYEWLISLGEGIPSDATNLVYPLPATSPLRFAQEMGPS